MLDLLKDLLKAIVGGLTMVLIPIAMVIGGGALAGLGMDNDWMVVFWIGLALVVAGLVWGAILYLFHS